MSKKKIWVLLPLGLLLLSLVVLAGCRPSTALTRLVDALNALNPSTETTQTEEEQEEDTASWNMDPIDEEQDDAKIREMDELIGQLLENMDEEEAEAAVRALYEDLAESHEWGTQQYNPDNLNDEHETGALALYISGHNISSESGRTTGTGITVPGTRIDSLPGVASGSGTVQSDQVPVTQEEDPEEPAVSDEKGGGDSPEAAGQGGSSDSDRIEQEEPNTGDDGGFGDNGGSGTGDGQGDDSSDDTQTPPTSQEPIVFDSFTGHNIAATGQAAIMVCMLGGADRLVATSPDFNANSMAQEAFNGSGQMHYATLWNNLSTDDGSEPMNDTEFAYLLNEVQPDLVIEMSGASTFSSTQLRQLAEKGVGYYALSSMYSIDTMKSVTKSLAQVMDDTEEGTPAMDISNAYSDWVNEKVNTAAGSQTTVRETVFIEDWDKDVVTQVNTRSYVEGGRGTDYGNLQFWEPTNEYISVTQGAAVIRVGQRFRPLTACLVSANVYNWSAAPHAEVRSSGIFNSGYGYGDVAGVGEGYYWFEPYAGDTTSDFFETKSGDYCYISPLYDRLDGTTPYQYGSGASSNYAVTDSFSFINGRAGIDVIKDSYYEDDGSYVRPTGLSFGYLCLGYSNNIRTWDTVIVKNQYIKEQLERNSVWQTNSETGKIYSHYTDWINGIYQAPTYYCTPWPLDVTSSYVNDMTINSTIGGDYTVLVNPTGLGDWTGQSPEAILETCWAVCKIQKYDGYGEEDLKRDISEFYGIFYGLDYAWNGPEIEAILAGPES